MAEGDHIDFRVGEDGTLRLVSLSRPVHDLFGILHRPGRKPVSVEEMNATIAAGREEGNDRRAVGASRST